jgi:hypothetical protein
VEIGRIMAEYIRERPNVKRILSRAWRPSREP